MKKLITTFGLIVGLSSVIVFLYFLILNPLKPIIFTEPILWIRIPEIIAGLISIVVLSKLILEGVGLLQAQKNKG